MKTSRALAGLITVGALSLGPLAEQARAATAVSTSGTTVLVTMTGASSATFGCSSGNVTVNGAVALPTLSCAAMTSATIAGDGAAQQVNASGLNGAAFTASPYANVSLGDGADSLTDTDRADIIDMGAGDDALTFVVPGIANSVNAMGTGLDRATIAGYYVSTPLTATIESTGPHTIAAVTASGATSSHFITSLEAITAAGGAGHDTLDAGPVTAASALTSTTLYGGGGNDVLIAGAKRFTLYGEGGSNTMSGGPLGGSFWTASEGDTLDGASNGAEDFVYDANNLRSGGRALVGFGPEDTYGTQANAAPTSVRIRPGATPGTAVQTLSLHRTGQLQVPAALGFIDVSLAYVGQVPHHNMIDVVTPKSKVRAGGDLSGTDILDITVPSGSWTVSADGGDVVIDPDDPAYGTVYGSRIGDYRVHGPWIDKDEGFVHRLTRDLLLRFVSDATRQSQAAEITNGTKSRATVTFLWMQSDEYRAADVDRVFVNYLRRQPDVVGRNYWIDSLSRGKSLRQFRAQLFGSPEYFQNSGNNHTGFVNSAYADVLGRLPDPAGRDYWVNRLNNGSDRGIVAKQFLATLEARENIVNDQFLRFLDRLPTNGEKTTWAANLNTLPRGERELVAFLANSNAYYNRN